MFVEKKIFLLYLISLGILFFFGKASYYLKLVDYPNERKIHNLPTSYIGGIAIITILFIALPLFDFINIKLSLILAIGFLLAIVGLIDDKININVGGKLSLQFIPIFYLVTQHDFIIDSLGDYEYFKINLGAFALPFTIICIFVLINSFNYFDGIDGGLSLTTISTLLILYFLNADETVNLLLLILIVPLSVFLLFNFSLFKLPKIFLGNNGSLLLGFILSFILIYINTLNVIHPILLAWSVALFIQEFICINLKRIINKKNPFLPGKDHLHHELFRKTKNVFFANLILIMLNFALFFIGYVSLKFVNSSFSFFMFFITFVTMFYYRIKSR